MNKWIKKIDSQTQIILDEYARYLYDEKIIDGISFVKVSKYLDISRQSLYNCIKKDCLSCSICSAILKTEKINISKEYLTKVILNGR